MEQSEPVTAKNQSEKQPTDDMMRAYRAGQRIGGEWGGEWQRYVAAVQQGDADFPAWFGADLPVARDLFFEAGFRGLDCPRWVRAERIGKVPACGYSTNFRDQLREPGVSVLRVYGIETRGDGTFELFNDGQRITCAGWLHFRTGTDGEPILVEAERIA